MRELGKTEQLQLLKFVCTFAWTDLQVQDEERAVIERLIADLDLTEAETKAAQQWLKVPPPPEEVDPLEIPQQHRQLFYETVAELVEADGRVAESERDLLEIFRELLHS